jgi:hypothetical protein
MSNMSNKQNDVIREMVEENKVKEQAEVEKKYGLDPKTVGLRFRAWFIVKEIEWEEETAGAEIGDLAVRARDGGYNEPDMSVGRYPNYRGTSCDGFDETYRYYYFAPLKTNPELLPANKEE